MQSRQVLSLWGDEVEVSHPSQKYAEYLYFFPSQKIWEKAMNE